MICLLRVGDVERDAQRRVPLLSFGEFLPMAFLCRVRYEINLCGIVAAVRLISTAVKPASSKRRANARRPSATEVDHTLTDIRSLERALFNNLP
jgi:hypothetical protein